MECLPAIKKHSMFKRNNQRHTMIYKYQQQKLTVPKHGMSTSYKKTFHV